MNPDELVDIIDIEGNVLHVMSKKEAHVDGSLHKTVIGSILNSRGEWMLVKQAADRQDAGQYVSPVGGHVSAGESEEEALKREAKEEVGFKESDFTYELAGRSVFERHVIGRHENHLFVSYKICADIEPTLNHEATEYRYFNEQELRDILKSTPEMFGDAFHFLVKSFFPELQ